MTTGWKVLTHDYRPPIQGGAPVWDGHTLPFALPVVELDRSDVECAAGWNYTEDLATALKIAGFWPDGRPSVAFAVEAATDGIARGEKRRASQLTLVRQATDEEVSQAIFRFSAVFGAHQEATAREQIAWRSALGRPGRDKEAVVAGLTGALSARGLNWSLTEYPAARAAWDAWAARAAWDAWAARAAWDAWADRAAWAGLVWNYAGRMGWVEEPDRLTTGLRSAYSAGLALAMPVGPTTLGWAMEP